MMNRKLLSQLATACVVLLVLGVFAASAHARRPSEKIGDSLDAHGTPKWHEVRQDGAIYVVFDDHAEADVRGSELKEVTIASEVEGRPVTAVSSFLREGEPESPNDALTSVVVPNSVTKIGYGAFNNCAALASITIPDSVTTIDVAAFVGCAFESITIPDSVTKIGEGAFAECRSLKSITLPDSVTSLAAYTFNDCSALASATLSKSLASIGRAASKARVWSFYVYSCNSKKNRL